MQNGLEILQNRPEVMVCVQFGLAQSRGACREDGKRRAIGVGPGVGPLGCGPNPDRRDYSLKMKLSIRRVLPM